MKAELQWKTYYDIPKSDPNDWGYVETVFFLEVFPQKIVHNYVFKNEGLLHYDKVRRNNRNERRNERTLSCSIHSATGVRLWQRAFTCAGSSIYQQCGAACVSSAWFVPWPSWARCLWLGFIVHVIRLKHLKTLTIPMNCLGQTFWTSQLYPSPPMWIWSCRFKMYVFRNWVMHFASNIIFLQTISRIKMIFDSFRGWSNQTTGSVLFFFLGGYHQR